MKECEATTTNPLLLSCFASLGEDSGIGGVAMCQNAVQTKFSEATTVDDSTTASGFAESLATKVSTRFANRVTQATTMKSSAENIYDGTAAASDPLSHPNARCTIPCEYDCTFEPAFFGDVNLNSYSLR